MGEQAFLHLRLLEAGTQIQSFKNIAPGNRAITHARGGIQQQGRAG
jgi:hypothetical protein